ncbi:hypothetical protein KUTeg_020611 [Tegillarca granosa]|uniref:Peptidyl-prolyl cis-trans isomerase n=1 Tax=Tegillarca granosa TaxID=220873 RepID=A0ABQ9E8F2_TEGGR|nr:hypothetical protein KUTeg_020611 [Tegillarca granosa]
MDQNSTKPQQKPNNSKTETYGPSQSIKGGSSLQKQVWEPKYVTLQTSHGTINLELFWKKAPKTCYNFAKLASSGYYNDTIIHRVIPKFMIQGGDPTGTGKGGQSIYGNAFCDEFCEDLKHNGPGILSMANSGPNTNGSQFFVTLEPTPWLDGKHTVFGRVTREEGLSVVYKIGSVKTDRNNKPLQIVKINKAYLSS